MAFQDPQLVVVLTFAMAAFLLLQTVFLVTTLWSLRRRVDRLEKPVSGLIRKTARALGTVSETLGHFHEVRQGLTKLETAVSTQLDRVSERLRRLDETAEHGLRECRLNLRQLSRNLEYSLTQFVRQTSRVQRWLRNPAVHASAAVQAGIKALRELAGARRQRPSTHAGDDQSFI